MGKILLLILLPNQITLAMKRNLSLLLALSALIMTAGCKKTLKSSVDLSTNAKAAVDDLIDPSMYGRVIRFDLDDGHGSSCLLYYDIQQDVVTLTQFIGASYHELWATEGFQLDNGQSVNISPYYYEANPFAQSGGYQVISFDANGSGHEDHLLVYVPGYGTVYLLKYLGAGVWHLDWPSSLTYTGGIGSYNLTDESDQIIAYDYGSGVKNALLAYRPGEGDVQVITNTGTGDAPNWTTVVKGSGGLGGFDLDGTMDQVVAIDDQPGAMDLACNRPSYGYLWYLTHGIKSSNFVDVYNSRTGFYNFNFEDLQDHMIAVNVTGSTSSIADNSALCYRPGLGMGSVVVDKVTGGKVSGGALAPGINYPMAANPYPPNGDATWIGDHVLNFAGNGYGNSSLVFWVNGSYLNEGTYSESQVYEYNPGTNSYTRVF
jgi:hypothetical protein